MCMQTGSRFHNAPTKSTHLGSRRWPACVGLEVEAVTWCDASACCTRQELAITLPRWLHTLLLDGVVWILSPAVCRCCSACASLACMAAGRGGGGQGVQCEGVIQQGGYDQGKT